jgi:putative phosphoribosyl transferase
MIILTARFHHRATLHLRQELKMAENKNRVISDEQIRIPVGDVELEGNLDIPQGAEGIVVFVHGSGSSRHSTRNRYVARALNEGRIGTLVFDLLTSGEEETDMRTRQLRFDIDLLARRTIGTVDWLVGQDFAEEMNIGLFGSSTGAAAALIAAAERPAMVHAVVSRGGRPDLAEPVLPDVVTPTLLIVGGEDRPVIDMNRFALEQLPENTEAVLQIVPGATHLFEESGTLEQAARLARDWFIRYLGGQVP